MHASGFRCALCRIARIHIRSSKESPTPQGPPDQNFLPEKSGPRQSGLLVGLLSDFLRPADTHGAKPPVASFRCSCFLRSTRTAPIAPRPGHKRLIDQSMRTSALIRFDADGSRRQRAGDKLRPQRRPCAGCVAAAPAARARLVPVFVSAPVCVRALACNRIRSAPTGARRRATGPSESFRVLPSPSESFTSPSESLRVLPSPSESFRVPPSPSGLRFAARAGRRGRRNQ